MIEGHLLATMFFLTLMLYWESPSIFVFLFVDCRRCGEQSSPGMCPCGAESLVGKKDIKPEAKKKNNQKNRGYRLGATDVFWPTLFLKMIICQYLNVGGGRASFKKARFQRKLSFL